MAIGTEERDRINRIFFPHAEVRIRDTHKADGRFVYYTTAETATSILRNKQIWMRNTAAMNDYLEVEHGVACLFPFYRVRDHIFNRGLDACFPGLANEITELFDGLLPSMRQDTYITSVSEHDANEDQHGRLSMWRAYGGQAGVALVLNGKVMLSTSNALNVFSSPVDYLNQEEFAAHFEQIGKNILREVNFIKTLDQKQVKDIVFRLLRFAILCTKHPAFREEREWRVVASPSMHPTEHATFAVEVIDGTPQLVLKLNLKNIPEQGLVGLVLSELLDRVIIGPCQFPLIVRSAFLHILEEAGIPEPEKRITVSGIPLRQP